MTTQEILKELSKLGNESTKRTHMRHGAKDPLYGVKVGDLKKLQKAIKKDHRLSLALYETGNSDAMYLAGLVADETKMTKTDLRKWVEGAYWSTLSEYTVPWIAAESSHGMELAREWIPSRKETIASAGWSTLSNLVSIKPDEQLNLNELASYLATVGHEIHRAPNRVRYTMNGYVIATGAFVAPLTEKALKVAREIGQVSVNMGETACKVPAAAESIEKIKAMDRVGKKRKMARC